MPLARISIDTQLASATRAGLSLSFTAAHRRHILAPLNFRERSVMTVAITGISVHLGRLVIARLKSTAPSMDIVGLARSPGKAMDLGLPIRAADYAQPATLGHALEGIDTLLLISASEPGKRERQLGCVCLSRCALR